MAEYPPPQDDTPIFNSQEFLIPLNATISQAQADTRYLARTGTAISAANTTSFTDNITVGSALIDYIPAQGVQIRPTVNSEALFLRVLDGTGTTKQRIECNATHQHLYDVTRITDSVTPTSYSTIQQASNIMSIQNVVNNSSVRIVSTDGFGASSTTFQASIFSIIMSPTTTISGLNGIQCNGAVFGRDDTAANTFNGTLGYTRYPIGWTVSATKTIAIPSSTVSIDVITQGTAITAFNNLSNGVWKIGCFCNNSVALGNMTFAETRWSAPTGATVVNSSIGQVFHSYSGTMVVNFAVSYPELIIRTTGNGTTGLVCNFVCTYSAQPTIQFNLWATKIA